MLQLQVKNYGLFYVQLGEWLVVIHDSLRVFHGHCYEY